MTPRELLRAAERARRASYAPYSRFAVGAALLSTSGRVYLGCNVENASFGLSICAERSAIFQAVSAGEREFSAIAVTAGTGQGAPPCGACRQVLAEFGLDLWVHYRDMRGKLVRRRLRALLADAFHLKPGGRR